MKKWLLVFLLILGLGASGYYFFVFAPQQRSLEQFKEISRIATRAERISSNFWSKGEMKQFKQGEEAAGRILYLAAELESLTVNKELKSLRTEFISSLHTESRMMHLMGTGWSSWSDDGEMDGLKYQRQETAARARAKMAAFRRLHNLSRKKEI